MEPLLATVGGWLGSAWNWAVGLNGALQVPLVLVCCVAACACCIIGRRMSSPGIMDGAGSAAVRTLLAVIAYIGAVVFTILMVFGLAAVFAPLLGIAM
ncbi:hypothetical protein [Bifidobacterium tsurumiense]|uniref:Uncharacterized protein n=1 Tax=Bifidobacterium tsurumiense TaxID=356829 RepID=A0A087E8D1_9BIFI|nr:hypothetical protein [Bifidobacterium tsurumiense]KFJ04032.1 hypothetical protein BITS_1862 [Bifidobacterium tsurumiense]